jgi:vitamin K-dependent gamma-carboxylase
VRFLRSFLTKVRERAFAPVDIASLAFFRIAFGLLIVWHVTDYFRRGLVAAFWIDSRFLFKFYGFSWIHPWPAPWLYGQWIAVGVFAFFVAIGFRYRASALLLFLTHTYFFLLDEARYVNHTYLICLFSFLLIFIPAHRAWSIDAWLNPKIRAQTAPAWSLWLLRFQIGVVYFYAGVAKIAPDWLQGEPMRLRLFKHSDFPLIGRFFREEWAVYSASYGSLFLDLFIVPLLIWRRTRLPAFCLVVAFHLINAQLFPIGIFPWLAIAATTLFFSPDWPRRIVAIFRQAGPRLSCAAVAAPPPATRRPVLVLSLLAVYVAIQVLVPLRHFLSPGGIEWNYAEHRFSWRMLLVSHSSRAIFYVTDPNTGKERQVGVGEYLNPRQQKMMDFLPDMPLQYAHYLATVMPRRGPQPLRVEARVFTSINGRKAELYLDPVVDLAAQERTLLRPPWLKTINDPLPPLDQRYDKDVFVRPSLEE